jgi:hypothetical protein
MRITRIGWISIIVCIAAGFSNAGGRLHLARAIIARQDTDKEIQKLGYFAGKWSGEVEVKASQSGPASKFTEAADSDWMPGGHFIVMHWIAKTQAGEGTALMILGYDSKEKRYTFNTFSGTGETAAAKGTVEGNTWTFYGDSISNGATTKSRFSMKVLSPTSCATKFEISEDGTTWTTVMEGRISKAASK